MILFILLGCSTIENTVSSVRTDKTASAESQAHYKKGRELVLENKLDEAINEFKQAIALSPDYWDAHQAYIELMCEMDNQADVCEEYKAYLAAHKDMAIAHCLYALALYGNDLEQEKTHAEEALKIDPGFYPAYSILSKYYDEAKDYDKAIACGQKAIEINPNYARGYCIMAQTYSALNETGKVIKNYEKALELDQYETKIHINLSRAYSQNNELDKAINISSQAIGKDKRPLIQVIAYNNRAFDYARDGNRAEALNDLDKAIALGQAEQSPYLLFMVLHAL
jgi:tetratricopeptide (TPR) repeat protein